MRNLAEICLILAVALTFAGADSLRAQTSNRVWFAVYNGMPTPSSDVAVQSVTTDGSASSLVTGSAAAFIAQTNFTAFNSPYDIAVDPAMGKAYVLDNNVQGLTPEYIYSFNLSGTPAQIAASEQIIFTMPVPGADASAGLYPLISGLALDPVNHYLYFNQTDLTVATNSFLGRLDLFTSSKSDLLSSVAANPLLHTFYAGQVPGHGPISLDATNVYLGAINTTTGNAGVYAAPRDGSGSFSEMAAVSANDATFSNGFVSGVMNDPADHYLYYLTWNAGDLNFNFNIAQNAIWVYDTVRDTNILIAAGYPGYPDNIAADFGNGRYYLTLGRDGTGRLNSTNYQAIYTGVLGSLDPPTRLYSPALSGEDGLSAASGGNAGYVALQGIFVEDSPTVSQVSDSIYLAGSAPLTLSPSLVTGDLSSTLLSGATVVISGGTFGGDGDVLSAVTNGTAINTTYNSSTETLTLSGSDTITNYQQVLRTVFFSSTNSDPTEGHIFPTRTISWSVTDGAAYSAPVASGVRLITATTPLTNQLTIAGVAGGWILLFTGIPNQAYVFQSAPSVTGPWTSLSTLLTANASGLVAYEDPLMPQVQARFYRVFHAPPTLASLSNSIYLAGGAPVSLSPGLLAGDPSATLLTGATITISGGIFAGDGDMLNAVTNGTAILSVYNSSTETLTLSGSDTVADYQQVLRSVSYSSTNLDPTASQKFPTRSILWTVTDGVASSAPITSSLTLLTVGMPATKHIKIVAVKGGFILLFTGSAGQNYVVQTATSLRGPWSDLSPAIAANAAGLVTFRDSLMLQTQTRYYRVRSSL
jgi:uncharacterized membrane protein